MEGQRAERVAFPRRLPGGDQVEGEEHAGPQRQEDGPSYPVLVPQLDEDGIPTGGVGDPAVAAPLGPFWGWNLRKEGFAGGNLSGLSGSFIPLPKTAEEANGDSRRPLAERYPDAEAYLQALAAHSEKLVAAGLMLPDDIAIILERGKAMYEAR